jgi:hypothetical protein
MPEQTSPLRQRMIDDMKLRNICIVFSNHLFFCSEIYR